MVTIGDERAAALKLFFMEWRCDEPVKRQKKFWRVILCANRHEVF
ncbi:hypothetical protein [Prosthecobacter sp.]